MAQELNDKITQAINEWLLEYDKIQEIAEIHTEELPDETNTLSLERAGTEVLPNKYIGEYIWRKEYQYLLLLKSDSETDKQRLSNLDWLDDLAQWIHIKKIKREFPIIDGKEVYDVRCANEITQETSEDGSIGVYYIQIFFDIKGEQKGG